MVERIASSALLVVLAILGACVSMAPTRVAQVIGASARMQQSKLVRIWRLLGVIVLIGSVMELAMMLSRLMR
jgi:hypothetical protein